MLCVCLADLSFEACLDAAKNYQLIELRLDRLKLCASELQEIFYQSAKVICTYKQDNLEAVQTNLSLLEQCLNLGASFIDLDLSTPAAEIKRLNLLAEKLDKKIILSWHSSSITDPQALTEIKLRAQSFNTALIKMVSHTNSFNESLNLLQLVQMDGKVIAFAMGEQGKLSRILSLFLGAPFAYVALDQGPLVAQGQFRYSEAQELLEKLQTYGMSLP